MSELDTWVVQNAMCGMSGLRGMANLDDGFRRLMKQCNDAYDDMMGRGRADGLSLLDRGATPF
ncbi:hypothetical protein [[Mycobacterium] zoologicum]|uniref:hypothetical protein n=1 Tax=[Mycobacterium] zoologicum TaxID=2872311 RepID=UPI001CDA9221|nr:hypothetical protein [Mycolicibacter sp. MYC101]MEB3062484.1 hypothetical protein [Mycolicibacter sp. MYC101]